MNWNKVRKVFFFVLNAYISGLALMFTLFLYLPFYVTVKLINWEDGINEKGLLSFKGFYFTFKKIFNGLMFPKISFFKKIGYVFILPLIKGSSSLENDDNPASNMFLKYFEALKDDRNINVAVEYLDSLHRKYTLFLTVVCVLTVIFYATIAISLLSSAIETTFWSSIIGIFSIIGMFEYGGIGLIPFAYSLWQVISALAISYLAVHFFIISLVITYSFFKEIRVMSDLTKFANESNKLVYLNLQKIYKDDESTLKILEKAKDYLTESCTLPENLNQEFLQIEEKFLKQEKILLLNTNEKGEN